jgi:hypothetical protein
VVKLLLVVVQPGVTGIRLPIAVAIMAKLSGKTDDAVGWLTGAGAGFPLASGLLRTRGDDRTARLFSAISKNIMESGINKEV